MIRATTSVGPPGGNATIIVIERNGQVCASAMRQEERSTRCQMQKSTARKSHYDPSVTYRNAAFLAIGASAASYAVFHDGRGGGIDFRKRRTNTAAPHVPGSAPS